MYVSNMWAMPFEDGGFTYGQQTGWVPGSNPELNANFLTLVNGCEYGAFRAPPLPFPPLAGELPEMTDTAGLIVATNGPMAPHPTVLTSSSSHSPSSSSSSASPNNSMALVPVGETGVTTATSTILTVRMIMQGKEVGSIIGKKGDNIKKFREDSGAKINISDGSCPERIVTVTGSTDNIHRAFGFITSKFEENTPTTPKPPVTLRLVVPASQCGSLIGKQGCKIKEIREATGASIQVASEMLPNSTERAVTVSGTAEAITECIKYVCGIMLESPPKGANLPYRPKPLLSPVYISSSQMALPTAVAPMPGGPHELPKGLPHPVQMHHMNMSAIPMVPSAQTMVPGSLVPISGLGHAAPLSLSWPGHPLPPPQPCLSLGPSLQYNPRPGAPGPPPPALPSPGQQAQEMNIPNDLIGCIIGRGGQKINEIRQVSGANIKISNAEDGSSDRKVTITGSPECIGLAQYLISTSMEFHKHLTLDPNSRLLDPASLPPVSSMGPLPSLPPPMSQMAMAMMKPLPPPPPHMLGLGSLGGLSPMMDPSSIGAPAPTSMAIACSMAGAAPMGDMKPLTTKMRLGLTATTAFKAAERPKFTPY